MSKMRHFGMSAKASRIFPLRLDVHTLRIDHVEQFQRGATRALRANFPECALVDRPGRAMDVKSAVFKTEQGPRFGFFTLDEHAAMPKPLSKDARHARLARSLSRLDAAAD